MLPSLKKIHSVDYAGQQRQLDGSTTTTTGSATNRAAPLMHSVSIVVELAVEKQPVEDIVVDERGDGLDFSESVRLAEDFLMGEKQSDLSSGRQTKKPSESETIITDSKGDNSDNDDDEEEVGEEEEEDDDDDDDEEAASCLSTDLARKVVIVDEADKILQFRAQSAEPRIGTSSPDATTTIAAPNNGSQESVSPPSLTTLTTSENYPASELAGSAKSAMTIRSNTIAGRQFAASAASSESRKWHRANTQTGPYPSTSGAGASVCGSTGELAERGDFAKLGMRRYTHHQVSYHPATIEARGSSASNTAASTGAITMLPRAVHTAQLGTDCLQKKSVSGAHILAQTYQRQPQQRDGGDQSMLHRQQSSTSTSTSASTTSSSSALLALSGGLSSTQAKLASGSSGAASGSVKNWSQRRQSLQINLLGSGGLGASGVCKSLTQEELRGEREFNEQVRNSKSPDSFTSTTLHHQHQQQQQQQYQQKLSSSSSVSPLPPPPPPPLPLPPAQVLKCQSQTQTALEGAGLLRADQSRSYKIKAASSSNSSVSSTSSNSANSSQETFGTKTCYQQIADLSGCSPSQLLLRSAITQKPTRQPKTAQIQRRRVSFGSIDPIIDRAETLPHPFRFNSSFQQQPLYTTTTTAEQNSQLAESADLSRDSSPTKSTLLISGGTRFAAPSSKFDRVRQQTSCSQLSARQKRHSLATTANTTLFSDVVDLIDRGSTQTGSKQDGQQLSDSFLDRRRAENDENKLDWLINRGAIRKTQKMSDNSSSMKAELEKEGDIGSAVNRPLMETFSTTLDGPEITDEPSKITSATNKAQQSSSGQVKDGSRVQSIMANAKLRQEEFARLLEEHEQIVNEIHRVETKMSNSQTNLQQRQQQQQKQQAQEQQQENK